MLWSHEKTFKIREPNAFLSTLTIFLASSNCARTNSMASYPVA